MALTLKANQGKKMHQDLEWMREVPIAHRGLHDIKNRRVENSLSAVRAAMENSFSIEVDLQLTKDKKLVVFHDHTLDRLTTESGLVRDKTIAELTKIKLKNTKDCIPSLTDLLKLVDGKIGLILELKGIRGLDFGYVKSVLDTLKNYTGPLALMSFDEWLLYDARELGCPFPLGLTAEGNDAHYDTHQKITNQLDIDFISYGINDLPCKFATNFKNTRKPIICWTVRDEKTWRHAMIYTDQITFEGFDPR